MVSTLHSPPTSHTVSTTLEPMLQAASRGVFNSGLSISTLYLSAMAGMFIVAGVLHPNEAFALVHGIWYLFCLPGGYLFLTIYSFANLDDRSWGTREEKVKSASKGGAWYNASSIAGNGW